MAAKKLSVIVFIVFLMLAGSLVFVGCEGLPQDERTVGDCNKINEICGPSDTDGKDCCPGLSCQNGYCYTTGATCKTEGACSGNVECCSGDCWSHCTESLIGSPANPLNPVGAITCSGVCTGASYDSCTYHSTCCKWVSTCS